MAFPTTSILDAFNRADEGPPPSANWTADPFNVSTVGHEVISNAASNGQHTYWSAASFAADQEAYVTISNLNGGTGGGLFMRVQSPGTSGADGYECNWNGTTVSVTRVIDAYAVETTIDSVTTTAAATGYKFGVEVTGTGATVTIKCYIDTGSGWTLVLTASDTGGTRITSGGYIGMFSQPVTSLDDFGGGAIVSATEQAAFRFYDDDGSESASTAAAAQDTNLTAATGVNKILRVRVQGSGDVPSTAFTLRAAKNGGSYAAVGVGASSGGTPPIIEAGDATESGDNATTPTNPWPVSTPALSIGDLIVMILAWDDSVNNTGVTPAAGPNGESWTAIGTVQSSASTEIRMAAYYTVATGSWSAGSVSVTPSANEQWTASVLRVPAGEFDASTPIGAAGQSSSAGTAETTINSPAVTAGSSDGNGRLVWAAAADADPQSSLSSGYSAVTNTDRGNVSLSVQTRDAAVANSESIAAANGTRTIAGDSWASKAFVVRAPIVANECYVSLSSNIAAGGEATTSRLTGGTGSFAPGRIWDNENGTDALNPDTDEHTEVAWCLQLAAGLSGGDYFDFRVYAGASPLSDYPVTPRWTVGAGGITEAVIMLAADLLLAPAAQQAALASAALIADVAAGPASLGSWHGVAPLAASATIGVTGLALLQASVTDLVAAVSQVVTAAPLYAGSVTFVLGGETSADGQAQLAGTVTQAAGAAISAAAVAQALAVLPLALQGQLAPQALAIVAAALGLPVSILDVASAPDPAVVQVAIALDALTSAAAAGDAQQQAALAVTATAEGLPSAAQQAIGAAALAATVAFTPQGLAQALGLLALAAAGGLTQQGSATTTGAAALAVATTLSPEASVLAAALLALAAQAQLAALAVDDGAVAVTIALAAETTVTVTTLQLAIAIQTFLAGAGLASAPRATQADALALALLANMDATARAVASGSVAIALAGLTSTAGAQTAVGTVAAAAGAALAPAPVPQFRGVVGLEGRAQAAPAGMLQAQVALTLSLAALFNLLATASGDPTIGLLAIVAEQLRIASVTGEALRRADVGTEDLRVASVDNERLDPS